MATFIVTNANDSGAGSLRQAILDANASDGPDTIEFDGSVFDGEPEDVIRLTSGELLIIDTLTINGGPAGVTITGDALGDDVTLGGGITSVAASLAADEDLLDDNTRVFNATAGDLTLIGLTLTGGRTTADFERGGAVRTAGALTLTDVTVAGNSTAGRFAGGGGVSGGGAVTVTNGAVFGNLTQGDYADGGGVSGGAVTLTNATISGNRALGFESDGGGAFGVTVTLTNATVTGNAASGDFAQGGGVYGFGGVTLTDSIVLGNVAETTGDEVSLNTVGLPAALTLSGGNILGRDGGGGADVFDGAADAGDTEASAVFAVTVDIGGGVLAGAPGDKGGPVRTVALRADALNPALDAAQGGGVAADARGVAAVDVADAGAAGSGAAVRDLGAFEVEALPQAPRLVVDTALDVVDPFDGFTSLREAVAFANATAGEYTVAFAGELAGATLVLTQGEIAVTDALVVEGGPAGVTLSGGGQSRIFNASAPLTLDGLTLTGGRASKGGAVYTTSTLSVVDSTFHGNVAVIGGAIAGGNTFYFALPPNRTSASVELTRSVIRDNHAISGREDAVAFFGSVALGGGLYVRGDLVARDSAIIGNTATRAPTGIFAIDVQAAGGGISFGASRFDGSNGFLDLANVTIADNRTFSTGIHSPGAGMHGAAISAAYLTSGRMENVTITGNVSYYSFNPSSGLRQARAITTIGRQPLEVTNSIVVGNSNAILLDGSQIASDPVFVGANIADQRVAGPDYVAAHLFDADGKFVRVVAPEEIFAEPEIATPDTRTQLIQNPPPGTARVVVSGAVRDNGGPVPTVALGGGANPALDAAAGGTLADARGVAAFDQPGLPGLRDLGAFELDGPPEDPSLVVTTAADVVDGADGLTSLREAIIYANLLPGADTITFDPVVFDGGADAVIRLGERGALRIDGELAIEGGPAGVTITGDRAGDDILIAGGPLSDAAASLDAGRVGDNTRLFIARGELSLENLTLTGGRAEGATSVVKTGDFNGFPVTTGAQPVEGGGAIWVDGAVTLTDSALIGNSSDGEGGGVKTVDLRMTGSLLSGNVAALGGGALALNIDVTDSTVDGNLGGGLVAELGSALENADPDQGNTGTLTVARSTISDNANDGLGGGGLSNLGGAATVTDSVIAGNRSTQGAGGVFAQALTLTDSAVTGNSGGFAGGIGGPNVVATNVTVAGNTASGASGGGGIKAGALTATNVTIVGNTAPNGPGGGLTVESGSLINSTVTGNLSGAAGGGVGFGPFGGVLTLTDSIVLGNAAAEGAPPEIAGAVAATGRNIVGADAAAFDAGGFSAIQNADPALVFAQTATLADGTVAGVADANGGPVETVALRLANDNPALGAAGAGAPATDARGVLRDAAPDLGAYEAPNPAPVATADAATTDEDVAVTIPVLANDTDVNGGIDPASVRIENADPGSDGLAKTAPGEGVWTVDTATGAIAFAPEAGFDGPATPIFYTVADALGARSDPASVSVDVTPDPVEPTLRTLTLDWRGRSLVEQVDGQTVASIALPDGGRPFDSAPLVNVALGAAGADGRAFELTNANPEGLAVNGLRGQPNPPQRLITEGEFVTVTLDGDRFAAAVGGAVQFGNPNGYNRDGDLDPGEIAAIRLYEGDSLVFEGTFLNDAAASRDTVGLGEFADAQGRRYDGTEFDSLWISAFDNPDNAGLRRVGDRVTELTVRDVVLTVLESPADDLLF